MSSYLDMIELDFFLVSQIYSLLHHGNIAEFGPPTFGPDPNTTSYFNNVEGGALAEFERVKERGMGVVAATVYNSGMMITGAKEVRLTSAGFFRGPARSGGDLQNAVCNYRPATQQELDRTAAIQNVCAGHEVPLAAAALQFPLAHPVVASMVVGFGNQGEATQAMEWLDVEIPQQFWSDLREQGLIDPAAPTPGP